MLETMFFKKKIMGIIINSYCELTGTTTLGIVHYYLAEFNNELSLLSHNSIPMYMLWMISYTSLPRYTYRKNKCTQIGIN